MLFHLVTLDVLLCSPLYNIIPLRPMCMRRILHLYSCAFRAEYTTEASHFSPTHQHCCRSQSTLLQVNMKHAGLMKSCAMRRKNDWHCDANHGCFSYAPVFVCMCGAHSGRRLTQTHSVLFSVPLCRLRVQS